ncbi:hypothetical protein FRC04_001237 [Tulasnella sp. 424]|nr:hypothetical protein FRC04_001237 [Tulasnella sp. 424]
MLPKLKHLAIFSDNLIPCFFGELTEGIVRPLTSMSVYFSGEANQESNHSLSRMLRGIGEGVQALSVTFEIREPDINWVSVMIKIGCACPNLRRLDVRGTRDTPVPPEPPEPSDTVAGNVGYWIAPLHALRTLELFNAPKGFFRHLVVRTGDYDQEIKFNHDIMLQLTHTCPSLRLISGALNQGPFHRDENLVYIRSAGDPDKQADLAKSRHTEEGLTIKVELLDRGQSTDYVWELYWVSDSAARDLWRVFLPHCGDLRFASEM